jgi:16S rRNA (adenine1518-N6/adenine1519-N6)-dimethyltransferase
MLEILKKYKIKAKKSLGQNFLVSEKILDEISDIIEISEKNIVEV